MAPAAWALALLTLGTSGGDRAVPSPELLAAIAEAIEDEVYDYSLEGEYSNIGSSGGINVPTRVPAYVSPPNPGNLSGAVIYRLMPYGEVFRGYVVGKDGRVVLLGSPGLGFSAYQPNTRTVFLEDEFVCEFKSKAVRISFEVDPRVSPVRLRAAERRQILRVGESMRTQKAKVP